MNLTDYLACEWVPALGCTEPASIAYAAATAAAEAEGDVLRVRLAVDPRIYKNCYAVGIPHSGHQTGIRWAAAIGAHLPDASAGLECFREASLEVLSRAGALVAADAVEVEVDVGKKELWIDCTIEREGGRGRAVIAGNHTNIVCVERDGRIVSEAEPGEDKHPQARLRQELAAMPLAALVALACSASDADRARLREGIALNRRIAEHGLTLFPRRFVEQGADEPLTRTAKLVCAGVYARMWGEDFPVMSLAGSGNKGIVASVPVSLCGEGRAAVAERVDEALALACLVTSATTHHLGSLSAVCGCSNAAGIGLAAGLVLLEGGGEPEISLALNNMVGNVTGMICDGAKIGCALKTMTAVDAAFRAAALAMSGVGIPPSDGIVGATGSDSLVNLGRIAARGMSATDQEILAIMQEKLVKR